MVLQKPSSIGNDLVLPSRADGILLTTGNLEDVTASSGGMTGLTVSNDMEVHGFMQFGSGAHAGECEWVECSDKDQVRTSGLVLPTADLQRGWSRIEKSWCSNIAAEVMQGRVDPDTSIREGTEVCGTLGSGQHCFRFINESLSGCMDACAEKECSILLASRFNLVELWSTRQDGNTTVSNSVFVNDLGFLSMDQVPTEGNMSNAWEMSRFNCSGDGPPGNSRDFPIQLKENMTACLVSFRTRTMASTRKEPYTPLYIAGGDDRTAAGELKRLRETKMILEAKKELMR